MDKSYLFFDIECANCFDGIGKMCSFGYVLTDRYFKVLDSDDVVMNPECEFDWYLFSSKNKCPLAYSKDYFRAQRNFESYYKPIKKLLEEVDRTVIGFASQNDVGFVVSACERYNLPAINFSSYDIAKILESDKQNKMKLAEWCEFYGIDISKIKAHKSKDDAMMTMLLAKAFCEEKNIELQELIEKNKGIKLSVEKYLEQREISRHNKEMSEKIKELYGKKCRARLSDRLEGELFAFGYKIFSDIDASYAAANLVYKHGGILQRHLKSGGTLLIQDGTENETIKSIELKGLKTMTIEKLKETTNLDNKIIRTKP